MKLAEDMYRIVHIRVGRFLVCDGVGLAHTQEIRYLNDYVNIVPTCLWCVAIKKAT